MGYGHVTATQLYVLAREKTQSTAAGCFDVNQGNIAIHNFNIFNYGGNLLLRYLAAAVCLGCFQDDIGNCGVTAHQHMAAGFFCIGDPVIMVVYLLYFT